MGFGRMFGHGEDEDEVPENSDESFARRVKWALAEGDRRQLRRWRGEEQEEEQQEPWSLPLRRWAEEREQERSQVPGRERVARRDTDAVSAEPPSPRMRRRRVSQENTDVVIVRRPAPKVVAFPSPDREIRKVCRDHLRRAVMVGKYPRVLIDED